MEYLCLIYLNEQEMDAKHLDFNDRLRKSGHFIEAEASRIPSAPLATIEVRPTRRLVVEGRQP